MTQRDTQRTDGNGHDQRGITRRSMLHALGAGAVAATVGATLSETKSLGAGGVAPGGAIGAGARGIGRVSLKVDPFSLADVRLLDGPFKHAQEQNAKYLLSLEPDRMLHNFRVNAGLEPKAPVYGGWESVRTWADIRAHGHTLGHYLTACAMMYASTGTEEFKKRCEYIVEDLRECQKAEGTGLVCAFPDKTAQLDNLVAGRRVIGVPWYTLHKIFAGLRDVHLLTGSATAREVLVGLSDWAVEATRNMTDAQFERMLGTEHGGMNEIMGDVYDITKDEKYLRLAERFCHRAVMEPLSQQRDTLNGMHANTQVPKFVGFQRLYELTGRAQYLAAAAFFWKTVVTNRSYATGGHGDGEHFFPVTQFQQRLGSAKTMETCCSHNMLRLTRMLFALDPTAEYGDFYEQALYNTILASQDPDSGMVTYFQSTRPGYLKLYCTPFDSFWCCTGTGIENHAKYGDSIYFRSKTGDSLYVNLYLASTLNWKEKGLTLTQRTRFPEEARTRLEITAANPVELALRIRHPAWCTEAKVTVNGANATTSRNAGSYIELKRTWRTGDVVEVELPMTLRMVALPNAPEYHTVAYGPIVLVGAMGRQGITPGADIHVNERTIGNVLNVTMEIPVFVGDASSVVSKIVPSDSPLTFRTQGLGRPSDVTLVPYYRIAHERYNMYWRVVSA